MKLAMIGLGKMGGNMASRLLRNKIEVVGFDFNHETVNQLVAKEGMIGARSVEDAVSKLSGQKIVWLMLPAGEITENQIVDLIPMLNKGDIIIDGGNSNYKHSMRRGQMLAEHGIGFMDCGTSGGIWGLENGYCLMVGATPEVAAVMTPALKALAPAHERGWAHVGPIGSGHFTKMIHNGIEYGMMQAMAEGLDLIKGKEEFDLDLAQITELWRHGSVVRSWLLDLTADAMAKDPQLAQFGGRVSDSGEGRWTIDAAIDEGVPAHVLTAALYERFSSRGNALFADKVCSAMRFEFGGHHEKASGSH